MSAAQHAERILKAWHNADQALFETELRSALFSCRLQTGVSGMDSERNELLETVALNLQKLSSRDIGRHAVAANFTLLRHLSGQPQARAASTC